MIRSALGASALLAMACLLHACAARPEPRAEPPGERRVLVTFRPVPQPILERYVAEITALHGLRATASWTMASLDRRCVVFEVPTFRRLDLAVRDLAADPRTEIVQPVQRFVARGAGAPEKAGAEPYRRLQHAADVLRLDAAHRLATGRDVTVAVVDTGIDIAHPELAGKIRVARDVSGRDDDGFTDDLHGTAVAGVIAARTGNGIGIAGVAPGAELLAIKACWPLSPTSREAECDSYSLALAVDFAVSERAEILNLSLAGPEDALLAALLEAALERGTVVVAAADDGVGGDFPASHEGVVAVRALTVAGEEPAADSASPASAMLAAPGDEILTTTPGGGFDFFSGASLAAAQVSGVAALVREHRGDLAPTEVARLLVATARENPGHAVVDACAALARALGRDDSCGPE